MADNPKHRWYQFKLRILLIGIALLSIPCAYIAHEARFVAARKAWMAEHDYEGGESGEGILYAEPPPPPLIRRWLGDRSYKYAPVESDSDFRGAKSLFPEAVTEGYRSQHLVIRSASD